jgi:HK97 family phage portal protein
MVLEGSVGTPVRASYQDDTGGVLIDVSDPEHVGYLRSGFMTNAGVGVGIEGAMRVAAAYRCLHIIAGACGNLPIDLLQRVSENERRPAVSHPFRKVITERPNSWQTTSEFRKMLTAHAVMKGDGFGLKITSRGRILEVWPMHPDRVDVTQNADRSLNYDYTNDGGRTVRLAQSEVLHLRGLTLNGVRGVGVLKYARESLGFSLQAEQAGARLFRQGVIGNRVFTTERELSETAFSRLKQQVEENNAGAENAHKSLILEDGLKVDASLLSAEDIQFLETRKFERSDVAMFFGVPPHMIGDTEKSTSWGSGIESQGIGFVQFTMEDWFTMWEQSLKRDCLDPVADADLYFRLQRQALMRGDTKARWEAHTRALQWGVVSPNEVRATEDMNPREGGDVFYDPPNTPGDKGQDTTTDEPAPPPAE